MESSDINRGKAFVAKKIRKIVGKKSFKRFRIGKVPVKRLIRENDVWNISLNYQIISILKNPLPVILNRSYLSLNGKHQCLPALPV